MTTPDGSTAIGSPPLEEAAIRYANLADFFDGLFDRLDATSDARLTVARVGLHGQSFLIRSSDAALLGRYLPRLAATPLGADAAAPSRIDFVTARDMGWPAAVWRETDWDGPGFEAAARACGYLAFPPHFEGSWILRQMATGNAVYFVNALKDVLPWDAGAPFRIPLHWAFRSNKRRIVHAGSLGLGETGVLMVGRGGSGKSATTLAGLAEGLVTVGDDYLLLELGQEPVARPLYRLVKQAPVGIARLPGLADRLGPMSLNWQGKCEFDPAVAFPGCMAQSLRMRAVLLPTIADAERTSFEPVAHADAARAIGDALLSDFPGPPGRGYLFSAALSLRLPTYRLWLSREPAEIGAAVRAFIAGMAQ